MDELVQLQKSSQQGAINIGPLVIPQNVFLRKVVLGCCFSTRIVFLFIYLYCIDLTAILFTLFVQVLFCSYLLLF